MNDLIPLYREMADQGSNFHGLSILQHKKQIGKLIQRYDAQTLLDFGCGRGDAYKSPHKVYREWGLKRPNVFLYDPAFKGHDVPPSPTKHFDGVLCSDVLEHVPEEDVQQFILRLFNHARYFVWASVCTRAAKKTFPQNGENLHVTLRPFEWWEDKFKEARQLAPSVEYMLVETP